MAVASVENIFPNLGSGPNMRLVGENDEQTYENYVASLIADAVDYDESELAPERLDNQRYFNGTLPGLSVDVDPYTGDLDEKDVNRSQAVSTEVQDTVMAILPSLMRIFFASENIVDLVPTRADNVDQAKQDTDYINYVFREDNDGFLELHSVFKDVLINKIGIMTWWTDDNRQVSEKSYSNITIEDVYKMITEWSQGGGEAEIIEESVQMSDEENISAISIKYIKSSPRHCVEAVPPDEFRIDRRAKNVKKSVLVGRQYLATVSDLVEKGYDLETIEEFAGNNFGYYSEERSERTPGIDAAVINNRLVDYGEYFIRVDRDGDGYSELRHICVMGESYHIVSDEPADSVQFAVFCGDPTPHTVVGRSITDLVKDLQNINTQLLRGALDSLSSTLFPDTYVNEYTVNLEDQLNDEVGKTVRVKGDPNGAIMEYRPTFVGGDVFEMMAQIDGIRQRRTGISEASKGVDPKALQSTNVMGIDAIVTGAQERIELIARILAETGFKDLFKGLLREITQHPNVKRTVQLRGEWVEVDHSLFDADMKVRVNPTMARGTDIAKLNALGQVKETQLAIISQFGPGNTVVTPQHFMNTIEDMLAIANLKNIGRYFGPITPELINQLQTAPKEPSPEELLAKAEFEKVKAQTAKALAELKHKDRQMLLDEDFRRDELGLHSIIELVKALGSEHGTDADIATAEGVVDKENTRGQ
jgi:hypothetical protein